MSSERAWISLFCILFSVCYNVALNKYSKEANQPNEPSQDFKDSAWKDMEKPFRLAKINLIWAKAQKRLTEFKLKALFSELKVQDKEELQLKRLKADNLDKNGLKEAEMRKKFVGIVDRYGLQEHFDKDISPENESNHLINNFNHNVFKDKKLNKLWLKAESAGFTETELKLLKDEFNHHQEKVLQFYNLLEEHNSQKLRRENTFVNEVHLEDLQNLEEKSALHKIDNSAIEGVRDIHRELKSGYDRLERMSLSGPKSRDFEESRVQALWRVALKGDFTPDEMESLRTELRHYEQRIMKLKYLQAQESLQEMSKKNTPPSADSKKNSQSDDVNDLKRRIKLQERKVEKLHADLEARITQRHLEL